MFAKFKKLPPLLQIAIFGVTIFLVFKAFTYIKTYLATIKERTEENAEEAALINTGMKLSYSKAMYQSFANDLETAMAGPGANYIAVYNIFKKMENDLDVIELNKAFGIRSAFLSSAADLKGWLLDESMLDIGKINQILSSKGITKLY